MLAGTALVQAINGVRETDPKKRVVITGMGVASVFGNDVEQFYNRHGAADPALASVVLRGYQQAFILLCAYSLPAVMRLVKPRLREQIFAALCLKSRCREVKSSCNEHSKCADASCVSLFCRRGHLPLEACVRACAKKPLLRRMRR